MFGYSNGVEFSRSDRVSMILVIAGFARETFVHAEVESSFRSCGLHCDRGKSNRGPVSKHGKYEKLRKFVDWKKAWMKKKRLTPRPVLLLLIARSKRSYPSVLAIDRPWRASNRRNPSSRPEIDPVAIPSRVSRNDPSTLAPARIPPPRLPDSPSHVRLVYADYYCSAVKRAVFDRIGCRVSTRPSISTRSSPTYRVLF